MRTCLYILSLLLLASCQESKQEVRWLNQEHHVNYTAATFELNCKHIEDLEAAYIFTGLQATALELTKKQDKLIGQIPSEKILFAGPARLVIQSKNKQQHIFNFTGSNQADTIVKDFRSPKTLITDSSLRQQQLVYTSSASRNIIIKNNDAAIEHWQNLAPKKNTYRALKNQAETAYYVEAGSCINIILSATQNDEEFIFTTNLLTDAFGNTIANGSKAVFYIQKGDQVTRTEKTCEQGYANWNLPPHIKKPFTIWLEIGIAQSNKIDIN